MFKTVLLLAVLLAPGVSHAEDLALLLARTCVAEIGFVGSVAECEIMWSVNARNAVDRGRSLDRQTRLFNSYWKSRLQRARRPWIKFLDGSERPKRWPSSLDWGVYVDTWLSFRDAAVAFLAGGGPLFHGCDSARDYGAPGERPATPYARRLRCLDGATRQRFWTW